MSKTASEQFFNLVDEPWIRVMTPDCHVLDVSLQETLRSAHKYKALAGEMEAQNVALLRLLIALTHRIFTLVDLQNQEDPVEDSQSALNRWEALMKHGSFPEQPIQDYLTRWHDRFWLIHPTNPFYQVPGADKGTQNTAAKLNGEVSESSNKVRLFSFLSGDGRQGMSCAEGARWLLFINGFDDCAAKQKDKSGGSRSMTVAWLGKLGLVTAVGGSLFETILLNMTMLTDEGEIWPDEDLPVWELEKPCEEERRTIPMPQSFAGLLTLQSRRLLLIHEGEQITGYKLLGGDAFSEQNAVNEPMTLWRFREDEKTKTSYFQPRRHDRTKQIWRDFGALVNTGDREHRPGVISWCALLKKKGYLPRERFMTFRIACVRYDSSQSSSITDSFSDALSFHANLLTEAGNAWIREINSQLELIDVAAYEAGSLAVKLAKACGEREADLKAASETAKEQFYLEIDLPLRDWLLKLDPEQDSDERNDLINEWQSTVRQIAARLGRQLVSEKGDAAFVGRTLVENKKERHYSSPEAYSWFRYRLGEIYPLIKEGDEQHG